jgi:hypothetical protein
MILRLLLMNINSQSLLFVDGAFDPHDSTYSSVMVPPLIFRSIGGKVSSRHLISGVSPHPKQPLSLQIF